MIWLSLAPTYLDTGANAWIWVAGTWYGSGLEPPPGARITYFRRSSETSGTSRQLRCPRRRRWRIISSLMAIADG